MIYIFFLPVEFFFAVFLLGAGTTNYTSSWLQTIEAHYLVITLLALIISFSIMFSFLIYGKMIKLHKILFVVTFLMISITVIGNYCTWSTISERTHQINSLFYNSISLTGNTTRITELFGSMRVSLGYLCLCMSIDPIIGYIAYRLNNNKFFSVSAKLISTIFMCILIFGCFSIFREMIVNVNRYIL